MITERVSELRSTGHGEYNRVYFWIAYPDHVAAYGHESDRIARARGVGDTKKEALANAKGKR
jgi:hypothetical protein